MLVNLLSSSNQGENKLPLFSMLFSFLFFFFRFIFNFIYFWLCWVFIASGGLSLVSASGSYSLPCTDFSLWWLLLLQSMGSRHAGFSSCGTQAQQLWFASSRAQTQQLWYTGPVALWHLPRPGLKPVSPALTDRFLTTVPPRKPPCFFLMMYQSIYHVISTIYLKPVLFQ